MEIIKPRRSFPAGCVAAVTGGTGWWGGRGGGRDFLLNRINYQNSRNVFAMDTSHSRVVNDPPPQVKVVVDGGERGVGELSSGLSLPNAVRKTDLLGIC